MGPSRTKVHDAPADGGDGGLSAVGNAQLAGNAVHVSFDGALRNRQVFPNLAIAHASDDALQHLKFAVGQIAAERPSQKTRSRRRRQATSAPVYIANRLSQFATLDLHSRTRLGSAPASAFRRPHAMPRVSQRGGRIDALAARSSASVAASSPYAVETRPTRLTYCRLISQVCGWGCAMLVFGGGGSRREPTFISAFS